MEIYVIKLFVDDMIKYFFNGKSAVRNIEYAHRFYSIRRAKLAIKSSEFKDCKYEIIEFIQW